MNPCGALVHVCVAGRRLRVCDALGESLVADAAVAGDAAARPGQVEALSTAADLVAGGVSAVIELDRTADALEGRRTDAVEGAEGVQTGAAVLTAQLGALVPLTLVHVFVAVGAGEAVQASTEVPIEAVLALGAVLARILRLALVLVQQSLQTGDASSQRSQASKWKGTGGGSLPQQLNGHVHGGHLCFDNGQLAGGDGSCS